VTDWSEVPPTVHLGETGQATWRTFTVGDLRGRLVLAIWRITGAILDSSRGGVTISLNQDVHGKSLSTVMLEIEFPGELAPGAD